MHVDRRAIRLVAVMGVTTFVVITVLFGVAAISIITVVAAVMAEGVSKYALRTLKHWHQCRLPIVVPAVLTSPAHATPAPYFEQWKEVWAW
jgi:hypothetical protein